MSLVHVSRLAVFNRAYQLSLTVHRMSLGFPPHETYELGSQLRRASKSICANLVEGLGKNQSTKETLRFVQIAIGSCDEVKLWLLYAKDLGYLDPQAYGTLSGDYEEVGKMLFGLKQSIAINQKKRHERSE